jgi:CPA2 family monovalent cation:H+ antiporter-2
MDQWHTLVEVVILLGSAMVLGTVAERLKQHAIIGYLIAGMVIGPNVLGLVKSREHVEMIAELGVALLLFTIGLEFSFKRMRRLGGRTLAAGGLQVIGTTMVFFLIASAFGFKAIDALALGLVATMSSTAVGIRLLVDRAAVDSLHGRNTIAVLLVQDVFVVPALVVMTALSAGGGIGAMSKSIGLSLLYGAGMVVAFYIVLVLVIPKLLNARQLARNRELPVLLAVVVGLGSTLVAHELGLSPALGAFVAGMILGESPFAVSIRSDVSSLKTLLVTLFFASIGMLGNPMWAGANWYLVLGTAAAILLGKATVVYVVFRIMRGPRGVSLATGLCLAQVGEFSFVLAELARQGSLIDAEVFKLIVASTIVTLIATPYLFGLAPKAATWIERRSRKPDKPREQEGEGAVHGPDSPLVIIGFGPAGQRVALALLNSHKERIVVVDANPRNTRNAEGMGLAAQIGNATQVEVLEHAGVGHAAGVVVTLPDVDSCRQIVELARQLNPSVTVVARARYHVFRWELELAGAQVVDEEDQLGLRLAAETRKALRIGD